MVLSPCLEGRGASMLRGELGWEERLYSRMKVCVDRVGAFDDTNEMVFPMTFLPKSGTTGVAQEPRSGRLDSASTCLPTRVINALERRERAAHRGDSDIISFFTIFFLAIGLICPYMNYILSLLPTERDGQGDPPVQKSNPKS
jgi:hypothetical protein